MSMMMAKCCCNTGTACGCTGLPSSVIVIATIEDCCGNQSSHSMVATMPSDCFYGCPCPAWGFVGVGRTADPDCENLYLCNLNTQKHLADCSTQYGKVFMRRVGVGIVPSDSEVSPCAGWNVYVEFTAWNNATNSAYKPKVLGNDPCTPCGWAQPAPSCFSPVSAQTWGFSRCCLGSSTWACSYSDDCFETITPCFVDPPTPCTEQGGLGTLVSVSVG